MNGAQKGEIPDWYSTNALQFFMDKYSYQEGKQFMVEIQPLLNILQNTHCFVYPDWWEKMNIRKVKLMSKHSLTLFGMALLSVYTVKS